MDNQVSKPTNTIQTDPTSATTFASSTQSAPNESDKDKSVDQVYKPIALFPNRLRNSKSMHMEKILEILNQVKLNMPLLDAIQPVPAYAKFLKDMCTKKRKINVSKKVFLATNIGELLSGPILIRYKDPRCPIIACTIRKTEISCALLDLRASINLLSLSVYQQLGLGKLRPTRVTIQLTD